MLNEAISLGKRQLVDSIWKSAGIEGLGTTFPNTEAILQNIPTTTTRDEVLFIVNMKRAWEFLFDNIDYPANLSLLREINKVCMNDIVYNPGEIRKIPVSIGGMDDWKPEMPNEGIIISDIEEINRNEDAIDKALSMFCYVARTQMFLDGNKRVAQLICNKILMENDVGILSMPYASIDTFKDLLLDFYRTDNDVPLKEFLKDNALMLTQKGLTIINENVQDKTDDMDIEL